MASWRAMDRAVATSAGDVIVRANVAATALFGVTAVYAAVVFSTTAQWIGATTAIVLFAVGVFTFLWAYWSAVQRSRTEEISVAQLYLLLGPPTPSRVPRSDAAHLVRPGRDRGGARRSLGRTVPTATRDRRSPSVSSCRCSGSVSTDCGVPSTGTFSRASHPPTDAGRPGAVTDTGDEIGQNADHG